MRHWVFLIVFLLALGTLRVVGCGDESPCGNCDDGNPCTMDSCESNAGNLCEPDVHSCRNQPVTNGTPCGSGEVCVEGVCCTVDRCIPPDGCDFTTIAEDGAFCISEDITPVHLGLCKAGVCVAPCDPASVEVTQCPVEGRDDLLCCPGAEACESHCGVGAFEVQP